MFKNKLTEEQQEKIKKSNKVFMKMIRYSVALSLTMLTVIVGLILGFAKGWGVSIGEVGMFIILACFFGIIGGFFKDSIREFEKDMDHDVHVPEEDLLSKFLKKSSFRSVVPPDVYEKLTVLKLSRDEKLKDSLFQEILDLVDLSLNAAGKAKQPDITKPLHTKEKQTLLIIIAALAKESKIDISKTSASGDLISKITSELGAYVSSGAIRDKLELIPNAIEDRSK